MFCEGVGEGLHLVGADPPGVVNEAGSWTVNGSEEAVDLRFRD